MNDAESKIVTVDKDSFDNPDYTYPSRFFIMNALGEYVFFLVRDRKKAQELLELTYGTKYTLRETHQTVQKKERTATGTNSRRGFSYKHKR